MRGSAKEDRLTACVITFGCQMNENDSEKIRGVAQKMGYEIVTTGDWIGGVSVGADLDSLPDLVVLNTCCVRENAERHFFGVLGACKSLKRSKPDCLVAVCGCMAHESSAVAEIKEKYSYVDFTFGTDGINTLPEAVRLAKSGVSSGALCLRPEPTGVTEGLPIVRGPRPLAYVPAMYGCDNFCTYCIVPYTRGRERSRAPGDIVAEAKELAAVGYAEIMLLGQNVNAYGKDFQDGGSESERSVDFSELLRLVANVEGIKRVRFMTSHPKDLSDRLIMTIAREPKIERHVHLPLQSGSDAVLARMNRKYTRDKYLRLIEKIRDEVSGVAITTDIIVGFPGETQRDFEDTMDLIERARFDAAFTFLYSPREGTPSAKYADRVGDSVARARFARLLERQNEISLEINKTYVGKTVEVLCEGLSKSDKGRYAGRTSSGKIVNFKMQPRATEPEVGALMDVAITAARSFSLTGRAAVKSSPSSSASATAQATEPTTETTR